VAIPVVWNHIQPQHHVPPERTLTTISKPLALTMVAPAIDFTIGIVQIKPLALARHPQARRKLGSFRCVVLH
jgi:hypothetical protein